MKLLKTLAVVFLAYSTFACSIKPADSSSLQQSYNDIESVTLKTGDKAPSFALKNSKGKVQTLEGLTADKNVMLVFYRGEWCPFCISQLESFEAALPELKKHNVKLVAISPDTVSTNKNTQRNFGLDYLFLSDEQHNTMNAYGVIADKDTGLPHPAIFLINQQGNIVWFYASTSVKKRPTGEQLLNVVKTKLL